MRKTLYLKFVIAYLIFAVFGFIVVATFMQEMTLEQLQKDKAEELYRAATMLAEEDAAALYSNNISIVSLKEEIDDMSSMLDSTIWIINPSGLIVISSAQPVNIYNPITIEGFDPTALAGSFYTVGDFHGVFSSKQLSVAAPITSG